MNRVVSSSRRIRIVPNLRLIPGAPTAKEAKAALVVMAGSRDRNVQAILNARNVRNIRPAHVFTAITSDNRGRNIPASRSVRNLRVIRDVLKALAATADNRGRNVQAIPSDHNVRNLLLVHALTAIMASSQGKSIQARVSAHNLQVIPGAPTVTAVSRARNVQAVRLGGDKGGKGFSAAGEGETSVAPLSRRQKSFLLVCSCLPSSNLRFDADL